MFCSILFWLGIYCPTFPFIVSFYLPYMQSDPNYIFNCSTNAFFYIFVSSLLVILFEILLFLLFLQSLSFLPLISLSTSLLFSMLIFSCLLLCLFQSPGFQLYMYYFFVERVVIPFFLFFYYLLDFSFFITICYDTTSLLHIVFSVIHVIPVSINIPVFNVLTDSLNMFLKLFLVFY